MLKTSPITVELTDNTGDDTGDDPRVESVALILALVKIVRDQTDKNPHEDILVDLAA